MIIFKNLRKNKKLKISFLIVVSVLLAILGYQRIIASPLFRSLSAPYTDHQKITMQIGTSPLLKVEVVNTPQSMTQGLSDRDELGADGMLFFLEQEGPVRFWMKDMKFNLDLVWIENNSVAEITKQVPVPQSGTPLIKLPTYSPHQPVQKVLEVRAGDADRWGLSVGDQVSLE